MSHRLEGTGDLGETVLVTGIPVVLPSLYGQSPRLMLLQSHSGDRIGVLSLVLESEGNNLERASGFIVDLEPTGPV